jgi:UDP-hydrolysing UDP-N-acetyl-D-glucosamine 2-epimerase
MRHCITKLSHLHFVAARPYAERVCQLGEHPSRVHVVGAAGLESIKTLQMLSREGLAQALDLESLHSPLLVVTLHPASLAPERAGAEARTMIAAIEDVLDGRGTVIVTLPNDDPGHDAVRTALLDWARADTRVHAFKSLGQLRYLSLLAHADAVVGNSSSALLEAPAFELPAVDIGERQRGRLKPASVLEARPEREAIAAALRRALAPEFRAGLADQRNPYGDGRVAGRILEVLASAPPSGELRAKHFYDLPEGSWRSNLALGTV